MLIWKALAGAVGDGHGFNSAVLPRGIGRQQLAAIADEANRCVGSSNYAVVVTAAGGVSTNGFVDPGNVIRYRAGNRLFIWADGEFDPDQSFLSSVNNVVPAHFPAELDGGCSVEDLARALALRLVAGASLEAEKESDLAAGIHAALDQLSAVLDHADGGAGAVWPYHWWCAAERMAEALSAELPQVLSVACRRSLYALPFCAAGFPHPPEGGYKVLREPKKYLAAFDAGWSSEDAAQHSLALLEQHAEDDEHDVGVAGLAWDIFDRQVIATGHAVSGLLGLESQSGAPSRTAAWAATTEAQFLVQSMLEEDVDLTVLVRGEPLPILAGDSERAFLFPVSELGIGRPKGRSVEYTVPIEVQIEMGDPPSGTEPPPYQLVASPKKLKAANLDSVRRGDVLVLSGELCFAPGSTWPDKLVRVTLNPVGRARATAGWPSEATLMLAVPAPWDQPTICLARAGSKAGRGRPKIELVGGGAFSFDPDEGERPTVAVDLPHISRLKKAIDLDVLAYFPSGSERGKLSLGQQEFQPDPTPAGTLYRSGAMTIQPGDRLILDGGTLLEFQEEEGAALPLSPIWASALSRRPQPMEQWAGLEGATRELRGRIETICSRRSQQLGDASRSLLQIALPSGTHYSLRDSGATNGLEWLAPVPEDQREIANAEGGPSAELLDSGPAIQFRSALREVLDESGFFALEASDKWLSRHPLRHCTVDRIEHLLRAYVQLVRAGHGLSPEDAFWATYPGSVFVIDTSNTRAVEAILLSPWHPLRLAWSYSSERAAAELAREGDEGILPLMQLLEGWNLPWVGPAPSTPNNTPALVAVPIDAGEGEVFASWSLLATFNNIQGGAPHVPEYAAGFRIPGAAGSGITAGGIAAATRDYVRVNPYLSTISIDLAASSPTPRSKEIDHGVLREFAKVVREEHHGIALPGGLRVYDSLHREGSIPDHDDVANMSNGASGCPIPITWKRYDPESTPASNIRIHEGSGVQLSIAHGECLGSLTEWPVRRVVARGMEEKGRCALSAAVPPSDTGHLNAYADALSVCEHLGGEPVGLQVATREAFRANLKNADWTLIGVAHADPTAVAGAAAKMGRMLWEWRPGFLPRTSKNNIESISLGSRPYMTIAQVPERFRESVATELGIDGKSVDTMFDELGRRGIGLASLLAMGTTHVAGALGFYLAYQHVLGALGRRDGWIRAVAPIDAVDPLLRAIAGKDISHEQSRADLLLIDAELHPEEGQAPRVRLCPIEIRCSTTPEDSFPSPGSAAVKEKLQQLQRTQEVLLAVCDRFEALRRDSDGPKSLMGAALAGVLEAALLATLDRPDASEYARLLRMASRCEAKLQVERKLLLWFQRGPSKESSLDSVFEPQPGVQCRALFLEVDGCLAKRGVSTRIEEDLRALANWLSPPDSQHEEPESILKVAEPEVEYHAPDPPPGEEASAEPVLESGREAPAPLGEQGAESIEFGLVRKPKALLGTIEAESRDVYWDPYAEGDRLANPHFVILGKSGSGKTQSIRALSYQLARQGVPVLMLDFNDDFVDGDFLAQMSARLYDATEGLPFNPLIPEVDQLTGDLLVTNTRYEVAGTLKKVHQLGVQQEGHLKNAIENAYAAAGYHSAKMSPEGVGPVPGFQEVKQYITDTGDDKLLNRLAAIFDFRLFDDSKGALEDLVSRPSAIRLTQLPSDELKQVAAELLLLGVYRWMLRQGPIKGHEGIRCMVVVDEAHKLAGLDSLRKILKEGRKYGLAMVMASQEAADFDDTVYANTGTLLCMQLGAPKDSERVAPLFGDYKSKSEIAQEIRSLPTFEAFLRNDHYNRGLVRIRMKPYYEFVGDGD